MSDALLTVDEVAKQLAVSPRTVWRMLRDGQLPVRWVRESARFVWADVVAALPSGGQKPRMVPTRSVRARRGAVDLTQYLKRKAETWPTH